MAYIKKLVMHGFKSFPKKTEIPLTPGINVVLGPNGSGKSNISDALCFVLGRLSIKSMRAAKAGNLIFMGSKSASPSKEASVEIVFDNSQKTFSVENKEISIRRIVRKNGQSIYKINNETKTRQEVLTLLAQAGIDPNGFNIILQGEIQNFVRMQSEERRKIIEEVSGISIYEIRKEKSIRELNKTEEKLKDVMTTLRERTSFLNNLERERQQALKYKKLEKDIKIFKASILNCDLTDKKKDMDDLNSEISKKEKSIDKIKKEILKIETEIQSLDSRIIAINSTIQKSTGFEQEKLNQEIANLRADLAGLNVRLENFQKKFDEINRNRKEYELKIREYDIDLKDLQKESPSELKTQKEVDLKKKELEKLEEIRKKYYMYKSELKSIRDRIEDKKTLLNNYQNESEFLIKQSKSISDELFDKNTTEEKLKSIRLALAEKKQLLENLEKKERELEKIAYSNEHEIENLENLSDKISKMDICPVCKNKITKEHMCSITEENKEKISLLKKGIEKSDKEVNEIYNKKDILNTEISDLFSEISKREADLLKLSSIEEKKEQLKILYEKSDELKKDILEIEKKKKNLEMKVEEGAGIEQKYETMNIEIQEISLRSKENLSSEISFKKRELERLNISIKQLNREEIELKESISEIRNSIDQKENTLEKKKKQEEELSKKFRKMIDDREELQKKIRDHNIKISEEKNNLSNIEREINDIKIDRARIGAEIENLETEILEFPDVQIIKSKKSILVEKLNKAQAIFLSIGSVNLRSLEVYDSVKQEYDLIKDKVEVVTKEKESIFKIIQEIDIKKKRTFIKTYNNLNEIFSRNFSQLSTKGQVFLDLENKKDPFSAGVNILVKTGHGKYFDVKSLSGGEQTLVALSLIFAIQELKPYYFYILDEIDAALDKRNSQRLAELLKKYMRKGQYIVISHNDEVILNATNLFGVSMHEGISKIISLKI